MYWLRLHVLKLGSFWNLRVRRWAILKNTAGRIDGVEPTLRVRTRVQVISSSDSRRALGLGANVRIVIADEPGAWSARRRGVGCGMRSPRR